MSFGNYDVGMNENCARSCATCERTRKQKEYLERDSTANLGGGEDAILEESASFGEKQVADGGERKQTLERIKATIDYMNSEKVANLSPAIKESCLNRHELCAFWAILGESHTTTECSQNTRLFHPFTHITTTGLFSLGECENNEAYMIIQCAPSCHSCHLIEYVSIAASMLSSLRPTHTMPLFSLCHFEALVSAAQLTKMLCPDLNPAL